jgi:hypothetical protein
MEGCAGEKYKNCNLEYQFVPVCKQKEKKMKNLRYFLVPVLVTLIILVFSLNLTANGTRKASAAPRAAVVAKYLMVPAAAFTPEEDGYDYYNYGYTLGKFSGTSGFVAPVYLPPGARIRMIRLFAKDLHASLNACAQLFEIHPKTGTDMAVGQQACTTGSSGFQQPLKNLSHYVKWYYGYYIQLSTSTSQTPEYAVMIKYTVNQ